MNTASLTQAGFDAPPSRLLRSFEDGLQIITYDPAHRADFARLNVAWLTRYFKVEPIDELVLGDPQAQILAPGGEILFARLAGTVVGTVGLKSDEADSYELTKMAVDERVQGKGYGRRLLEAALELARERGKQRVILYTQTSLGAALHLYYKSGFVDVPGQCCDKYARCNLKMEKKLK